MGEGHSLTISNDVLIGADQIAVFLFGSVKERRRVYYLAENALVCAAQCHR
jgi:hypothetical protein